MIFCKKLYGVCAIEAHIVIQNGVIHSVMLMGGCDGQGKVLNALLCGMEVETAIEKLKDIDCGHKGTSCAAELARVLKEVMDE